MPIKSRAAIAYQTHKPMVIDTVDVDAPGPGEVLVEIKATQPNVEVIMVTSSSDPETVQESIQNGASGFIIKPFNAARVLDTLARASSRILQRKP